MSPNASQSSIPTLTPPSSTISSHTHPNLHNAPLPTVSQSESPSTSDPSPAHSASHSTPQPYSCLQCKARKIKCTRLSPCENCLRSGTECIFRAPAPPRRKKRRRDGSGVEAKSDLEDREELLELIARYEAMLRDLGALSEGRGSVAVKELAKDGAVGDGRLISQQGKSRYLENNLWTSVSGEFQDPKEMLEDESDGDEEEEEDDDDNVPQASARPSGRIPRTIEDDGGDLVFPTDTPTPSNPRSLHPQPVQIFTLWQTFLENVNPLTKMLHAPTMQKTILEASRDLDHLGKGTEALLFGIYVTAVTSMTNRECEEMFGERRIEMLRRFQAGAKLALKGAGFLKTSDLNVLQGFVLFLYSGRLHYDPHTFWTLTGLSIRIAQRIGLHKDGSTLGLPPFDTEMRRRLWMLIVQLDSRAAELSGSGLSIITQLWNTKPPLNINDCDLYPDMKVPPTEHEKATEMMFVFLRTQVGAFLKKKSEEHGGFDGGWAGLSSPMVSIEEKDRSIDELEALLEEKVVRYCDPQIPLHYLSSMIAKAAICKMRLFAHLPRNKSDNETTTSQAERNMLFQCAQRILEYDSLARSDKSMHRFLWHVEMHFQWHALIYVLNALRNRTIGPRAENAWKSIDEVFTNHPELVSGGRSKLCVAVGNLTLKAWEAREIDLRQSNPTALLKRPPQCIVALRGKRLGQSALPWLAPGHAAFLTPLHTVSRDVQDRIRRQHDAGISGDFATMEAAVDSYLLPDEGNGTATRDLSPIDWEQWDSMLRDFELQDQGGVDPDMSFQAGMGMGGVEEWGYQGLSTGSS